MNEVAIPVTKTVTMTVPNGELRIRKVVESIGGVPTEAWQVEYHNPLYKGSPFIVPTSFSTSFSIGEVARISEVLSFLRRFE